MLFMHLKETLCYAFIYRLVWNLIEIYTLPLRQIEIMTYFEGVWISTGIAKDLLHIEHSIRQQFIIPKGKGRP